MARYKLTDSNGKSYVVTADDDATPEQVQADFENHLTEQEQPREQTSALSAGLQGGAQGLTFGFADEIYGAGRGLVDAATSDESFSDAYAQRRDEARKNLEMARQDQPVAAYGGELISGAALPLGALRVAGNAARLGTQGGRAASFARALTPTANLATTASLGARIGAGAREGAQLGALYGLGSGQGDVLDHAQSVAGGALTGGAFGAALPPVVDAGRAIFRGLGTPIRSRLNPQAFAAEKQAQAIARDAGDSMTAPAITQALDDMDARARLPSNASDPTLQMGDLAGENQQGLMRQAFDTPNDAVQGFKSSLFRRQGRQWKRLENQMAETVVDPVSYRSAVDDIVAKRDAAATPAFKAAYAIETPMTPKLDRVLQRPTMQELQAIVQRSLMDEDKPIGLMTRTEMLHRMKVELDTQINMSLKAERMGNRPSAGFDTRTLMTLKTDLLNAIDNKPFKKALAQYATPSALKNAADDGLEDALRLPPEDMAKYFNGLSDDQKELYRIGAMRAIAAKLEGPHVGLERTKYFDSPDMKKRMATLWPDRGSLLSFRRALLRESRKNRTLQAMTGGSKTSKNLKFSEDSGEAATTAADAIDLAQGVARLSPTSVLRGAANLGRRFMGMTPEVSAEILRNAQRPASQGLAPEIRAALPSIVRRNDPSLYDPWLTGARGAFVSSTED